MTKKVRSARGTIVDVDLISIKNQLATKPVPVGVDQRRKFIDQREGLKPRGETPKKEEVSALDVAVEAMQVSKKSKK